LGLAEVRIRGRLAVSRTLERRENDNSGKQEINIGISPAAFVAF
jgi:hypothetical protein